MKKHTDSKFSNVMGWAITAIMAAAVVALLITVRHNATNTASVVTPKPSATATPSTSPSVTAAATPIAAAAGAASVCSSTDLKVAITPATGGNAAGTAYYTLGLTNDSQRSCTITGYPGVSLVDAAGAQLGDAASRNAAQPVVTLTLGLGQAAYATVGLPDAGNFPPGQCTANSTNVRVFPPAQTTALTAPFAAQACSGWTVTALHATQP